MGPIMNGFKNAFFVAGSLHEILDMVRILLSIWNRGRKRPENYTTTEIAMSAPLVPLLRR